MTGSARFDHDAFARSVDSQDFRRQIKRTVGGEPLSDDAVFAIADFVASTIAGGEPDRLLDVGCGNGELLSLYARGLTKAIGIDPSEYLIQVAQRHFASERLDFVNASTVDYLAGVENPERFTRVCFFASFQYLSPAESAGALQTIARRFTAVSRVVLGNLPDLDRREAFAVGAPREGDPDTEHLTAIGRWLTLSDIKELAPPDFKVARVEPDGDLVGGNYRFHAVLDRLPEVGTE